MCGCRQVFKIMYVCISRYTYRVAINLDYGVDTISRLLEIVGLFCKRAIKKRRYSANETYNVKEPTDCRQKEGASERKRQGRQREKARLEKSGRKCRTAREQKIILNTLQHTAAYCNILQHSAAYCNSLQHTATHCNAMQHTQKYRNALQHTHPTHCIPTLQHTATNCISTSHRNTLEYTATHRSALQRTAPHCNTLQHTATHCNILQQPATQTRT